MSIDPAFMIIKSGSKPSRSRSYILHFALSTIDQLDYVTTVAIYIIINFKFFAILIATKGVT